MTYEIDITVNYEVKYNKKTGVVPRATMIKVGKELFKTYKETKKAYITAFVTDSTGTTLCWGFSKLNSAWLDFAVDCTLTEGETEDMVEMSNSLSVDWVNGQHRDLDWKEATIEHNKSW